MMTWWLWRWFYDSLPRHPLFWQSLNRERKARQAWRVRGNWRTRLLVVFAVILTWIGLLWLLIPFAIGFYLLMLTGGALMAGAVAAAGTGAAAGSEHELRRYDLIAVTTAGTEGIAWALGTRVLRTNRLIVRVTRLIRTFHALLLVMTVLIGLFYAVGTVSIGGYGWIALVTGLLFVAALHLDFIQTVLLGAITGLVSASMLQRRVDSAVLAVGLLLGMKFGLYSLLAGLLSQLGGLLDASGFEDSAPLLMFAALILVLTLHEAALYLSWTWLSRHANLDPQTLQTMPRYQL